MCRLVNIVYNYVTIMIYTYNDFSFYKECIWFLTLAPELSCYSISSFLYVFFVFSFLSTSILYMCQSLTIHGLVFMRTYPVCMMI